MIIVLAAALFICMALPACAGLLALLLYTICHPTSVFKPLGQGGKPSLRKKA